MKMWALESDQAECEFSLSGPQLPYLYNGMVGLDGLPAPTHTIRPCWAALTPPPNSHVLHLWLSAPHPITTLPLRKLADCAQLLEVDDMVRFAVPDSKCVYTYIQELYRSLVQKGLVKTKKK